MPYWCNDCSIEIADWEIEFDEENEENICPECKSWDVDTLGECETRNE